MNAKQPLSMLALALGLATCGVAQANDAAGLGDKLNEFNANVSVGLGNASLSSAIGAAGGHVASASASVKTSVAFASASAESDVVVASASALTAEQPATSEATAQTVVATTTAATPTTDVATPVVHAENTVKSADVVDEVDAGDEFADPYERTNRKIYTFNDTVDKATTKPLARGYQKVVPEGPRLCASNIFSNLGEPYTAVNNLLQGKPKAMFQDIGRLLLNSTLGIGGCIDVASQWGIPKHTEDFGQTLAVWGVPSGPYVVLPVLGPSTVRDALSKPVDFMANPIGYITHVPLRNSLQGYKMLDTRTKLLEMTDTLEQSALDPYVMTRDAWLQRRLAQVKDEDGGYERSSPSDGAPRQLEIAPRAAVIQ